MTERPRYRVRHKPTGLKLNHCDVCGGEYLLIWAHGTFIKIDPTPDNTPHTARYRMRNGHLIYVKVEDNDGKEPLYKQHTHTKADRQRLAGTQP